MSSKKPAKEVKKNTSTLNAAHRLELMEARINQLVGQQQSFMNNFNILADEIDKVRELAIGVGRRVNAAIQAAEAGNLTNEAVNNLIIEDNVKRIKEQVTQMVQMGAISPSEEITENSFFVGRELDESGKVSNPRLQMSYASASKSFQAMALGKKVGDTFLVDPAVGSSFEVTEVYQISAQDKDIKEDENEVAQVSKEA